MRELTESPERGETIADLAELPPLVTEESALTETLDAISQAAGADCRGWTRVARSRAGSRTRPSWPADMLSGRAERERSVRKGSPPRDSNGIGDRRGGYRVFVEDTGRDAVDVRPGALAKARAAGPDARGHRGRSGVTQTRGHTRNASTLLFCSRWSPRPAAMISARRAAAPGSGLANAPPAHLHQHGHTAGKSHRPKWTITRSRSSDRAS